jgi:hypothetical protein
VPGSDAHRLSDVTTVHNRRKSFWRARLAEAVATLPKERAEEFRARFFAAVKNMQTNGDIAPEFAATLHRARVPE